MQPADSAIHLLCLQPDDSRPEVTSQLIKGKFMIGIKEGKKVSNFDKTKMLGCESWLCPTGRSYR